MSVVASREADFWYSGHPGRGAASEGIVRRVRGVSAVRVLNLGPGLRRSLSLL